MQNICFNFREFTNGSQDHHCNKATRTMLALCAFHLICTLPYGINHGVIHSYLRIESDNIWNFLIGICWWPFGCNFLFYVLRHDQYRNAYQLYLQDKIIPCLRLHKFTNLQKYEHERKSTMTKVVRIFTLYEE